MRLFAKSNRVSHFQYGNGTITSTDEQYTVIEFDEHGLKKFITTMVSLEPSGEPAPAKPTRAKRARKTAAKTAKSATTTATKAAKSATKTGESATKTAKKAATKKAAAKKAKKKD